jgi:hypothetical protein
MHIDGVPRATRQNTTVRQQSTSALILSNQLNDTDAGFLGDTGITQRNATVWQCLYVKDHDLYMDEYADYYFGAGFTFLRIFDNSANYALKGWSGKDGIYKDKVKVTSHADIKGKTGTQEVAYEQCFKEALEHNVDWVATFDGDEFLVLKKHASVVDLMNKHCPKEKKCGQLSVNWRMFGSSNQTNYHPIPVTRRFQYMMDAWKGVIKVIADPKTVDMDNFFW